MALINLFLFSLLVFSQLLIFVEYTPQYLYIS